MMNRKSIVAAVAALSLGFGTACTLVRAQDTPQDKQTQDKNPSAQPDKNKTDDPSQTAGAVDADLQAKMAAQEKTKADLLANFNDADFVKVASMANQDEIDAAQAAVAKTTNDDVKNFAQHMIDDHTNAGTELKSLAEGKGWAISDKADVKHMLAIKDMQKMNNADFDKFYASSAVADHQEAIQLFKLAADKASDPDLKAFATNKIPTFEMHLKMAQDLEQKTAAVTMAK
jgi:putative membrane protein